MSATESRRLTLADAYRDAQHVIDQLTTRAASEPSASVEITRNAAGNAQFTVKVYAPSSASADDVEAATGKAYSEAVQAYDSLNAQYPHVDPKTGKTEAGAEIAAARAIAKNAARPAALRAK